ncbi:ATP phosphoribosyltransferase regulatory subunit, partial [bacterium]|nr:ATP phosphoribosyltransferase regulatory subunit [bacterium]
GAQDAICGGGRYNGLAEEIGGKNLPAVGFAAGIERTISLMTKCGCSFGKEPTPKVIVIPLDDSCEEYSASILGKLRSAKISSDMIYAKKNLKKIFKELSTSETEYAYVIGADEMSANKISVKLLREKNQVDIPVSDAVNFVSVRGNC